MSVFRQNIVTPNVTDLIGFGATLNPDGSISAITGPTIGTVNAAPAGVANPGSMRIRRDAGQVSLYLEMDGVGTWRRIDPNAIPTALPLPIAEGGTAAASAAAARTSLSSANVAQFNPATYDDFRFDLTTGRRGALSKPDYDYTNLGFAFPKNDPTEIIYLSRVMTHRWQLESALHPHFHWSQAAATQVIWKIDYRILLPGQLEGGWTILTSDSLVDSVFAYPGAGRISQIGVFPDIDMTGVAQTAWEFQARVYRDDNVTAGDVVGRELDLHIQQDSTGTTGLYAGKPAYP